RQSRIAGNRAGNGVHRTAACGDHYEQIRLVRECLECWDDQEVEIVICHRPLRGKDDLARAVQLMGPRGERGLVWNDGQCADEMNRSWYNSRELETRNGQLHVGICKFDDAI